MVGATRTVPRGRRGFRVFARALLAPTAAGKGISGDGMVPHRRRSDVEVLGESSCSGGPSPSSPCPWSRLWASLLRWLRPRVWAPLDAEEVARETVFRTLRIFGQASTVAWAQV